MPASIWRSAFGRDREGLIGHPIDADKLEKKIPENLSKLDMQLSMLEPLFDRAEDDDGGNWIFSTSAPGLADVSLLYELSWARDVAKGRITEGLTQGETREGKELEGADPVFNAQRYPRLFAWFRMMERYFENLPDVETKVERDFEEVVKAMKESPALGKKSLLLPTPRSTLADLDGKCGLTEGAMVSIAPDDTGRDEYVCPRRVELLTANEELVRPLGRSLPCLLKRSLSSLWSWRCRRQSMYGYISHGWVSL